MKKVWSKIKEPGECVTWADLDRESENRRIRDLIVSNSKASAEITRLKGVIMKALLKSRRETHLEWFLENEINSWSKK
jgi:hypothetical protein